MPSKIERIFQVGFPRKFYTTKFLGVAVYRMPRKGHWLYTVATSRTTLSLPAGFDNLEEFRGAVGKTRWRGDWDALMNDLNEHDWHLGKNVWCHANYADRIWEEFLFWHNLIANFWMDALRPKEFYDDLEAEEKAQGRSHLQLVRSRPHTKAGTRNKSS